MKITGSIMPSSSMNETSKITSDSSSLILKQENCFAVTAFHNTAPLYLIESFLYLVLRRLTIVLGLGSSRANHACQRVNKHGGE